MKLGADTVATLQGTTLASAREQDALVVLNRGAPKGGHTEAVKRLVAAAVADKPVSAVTYTKSGAAFRGEDIDPASTSEIARTDACDEELQVRRRHFEFQNIALRSEVEELKAALDKSNSTQTRQRFLDTIGSSDLLGELERRLPAALRNKHQTALKAIRRALDSGEQHTGLILDLEAVRCEHVNGAVTPMRGGAVLLNGRQDHV
jgi:hypothetical protein